MVSKFNINSHIGIKSCSELKRMSGIINMGLNTMFKGKDRLGDFFDWWTNSCNASLCKWKSECENDIPNCSACSLFVKNSKITFVLEAKIDFNPLNNNEEPAKQKFRQ